MSEWLSVVFQNTYGGGGDDAFIVKFDANGNRVWATYFGGNSYDYGYSIALDGIGNIYLTGGTESNTWSALGGFQNTYAGAEDAFLGKFNAVTGNLFWATYYGGISLDEGEGVAADLNGNVYMAGYTFGSTGMAFNGFQNTFGGGLTDDFLVKFDSTGNRLWATYYGGSAYEEAGGVATDANQNVYFTGKSSSTNGIAFNGFQNTFAGAGDAFIAKFNPSGNRIWATYYGGLGDDIGCNIVIQNTGVYLGGYTESFTGIALAGFQNYFALPRDCFAAKFDTSGNRYCATYYGSSNAQNSNGHIAVDQSGNVYLSGETANASGISSGGFQNVYGGGAGDAFLVKFTTCCAPPFTTVSGNNNFCDGQTTTLTATGGTIYSWSTGATTSSITVTPHTDTTYVINSTNGSGCSENVSYSITVNPLPIINITGTT